MNKDSIKHFVAGVCTVTGISAIASIGKKALTKSKECSELEDELCLTKVQLKLKQAELEETRGQVKSLQEKVKALKTQKKGS